VTTATPGPWWVGDARNGWAIVTDDGATTVASVMRSYPPDSDDDEQRLADAKLIAAAPLLADALERAMGCIRGLLARTPVRDVAETEAEARAALRAAGRLP
jgi:hypothetical protein